MVDATSAEGARWLGDGESHAIQCSRLLVRTQALSRLKLGALADHKPVKLTIELPGPVHCDLAAYVEVLGRTIRPTTSGHQAQRESC